ncbi:hypothetical protein ATY41_01500 [Leifsonia xyli subsp. xyli]|uniref:Uncharacterized protein n=2 Tax=Leifsonia xyli subsp. xyli TaxID=59736 RepID=Q6ADN8_LEIXX|nr:hypothetical protein [Leifsonia xyli]AAT89508.1 hypothetical protein Lxx17530 [Leifsonia xyli subsp. xyli str. CTCB07]ODA91381.1 hypothetical protein ATY41_01500 [Leifsonia xyli subsp. xyli]
MLSFFSVLPKGIARVALVAALVTASTTATGSAAHAAPTDRHATVSRPLVYVGHLHVPHSGSESKVDLYGSVTVAGNRSGATSTRFSASEYNAVALQYDQVPFTSNGVQDVSATIKVDLWENWQPVFISDTHIAYGTIDTSNAPYGFNKVKINGDDGRFVEVAYLKLAHWSRVGLYGVTLTNSDDDPAKIYGSIRGDFKQNIWGSGTISPYWLFGRYAAEASQVRRGSPIWLSTPPYFFYLYPDRENNVRVSVDIWGYNYIFANAHIAQGIVTIPTTTSTTPVEGSSEIPGPNGSVTVYWQSVLESETD